MRKLIFSSLALSALLTLVPYLLAASEGSPHDLFFSDDFGAGSYLGVDTRDVTPDRLAALKLKEEHGVEITLVDQDAPAGKAGLHEHDVILTFNGAPIESVEQLRRVIHETPPGRTASIGVSRDGQPLTLKVQLVNRRPEVAMGVPGKPFKVHVLPAPQDVTPFVMPDLDIPAFDVVVHSSVRGGLMVENLTPQLGEYFGVKEGHGVLVRSVEKGSPAESAGFRAGDVVVRVGNEQVADTSDWRRAMRVSRTEKGPVRIGIVRERKVQTLSFTPPRQTGNAIPLDVNTSEISADLDLNALRLDMERLRPEIERASLEAKKMQRELQQHKAEWQREARKATQEMQRQMRLHQREIQKSMDDSLRSLHEELEEI